MGKKIIAIALLISMFALSLAGCLETSGENDLSSFSYKLVTFDGPYERSGRAGYMAKCIVTNNGDGTKALPAVEATLTMTDGSEASGRFEQYEGDWSNRTAQLRPGESASFTTFFIAASGKVPAELSVNGVVIANLI